MFSLPVTKKNTVKQFITHKKYLVLFVALILMYLNNQQF